MPRKGVGPSGRAGDRANGTGTAAGSIGARSVVIFGDPSCAALGVGNGDTERSIW